MFWTLDILHRVTQQQINDNINTDKLFIGKGQLQIQREITTHEHTYKTRPSHDKRHLSHTDRQTDRQTDREHRYMTGTPEK
jgi:hypothetical protein